jgi:hypothetical protein
MYRPAHRGRRVDVNETEQYSIAERNTPLGVHIELQVSGGAPVEIVLGMGVETPIDCPGKIRLVDWVPCVRGPESCCTNGLGLVIYCDADRYSVADYNRGGNPDSEVMP